MLQWTHRLWENWKTPRCGAKGEAASQEEPQPRSFLHGQKRTYHLTKKCLGIGGFGRVVNATDGCRNWAIKTTFEPLTRRPLGWVSPFLKGWTRAKLMELSLMQTLDHPHLIHAEEIVLRDPGNLVLLHTVMPCLTTDLCDYLTQPNAALPRFQAETCLQDTVQKTCLQDTVGKTCLQDTVRKTRSQDTVRVGETRLQDGLKENVLEIRMHVAKCVSHGLTHLHSLGFAHLDIKPENILLKVNPGGLWPEEVKIADYGSAVCVERVVRQMEMSGKDGRPLVMGTVVFAAPEFGYNYAAFGVAADWWSFGVLLLELFFDISLIKSADTYWEDLYQKLGYTRHGHRTSAGLLDEDPSVAAATATEPITVNLLGCHSNHDTKHQRIRFLQRQPMKHATGSSLALALFGTQHYCRMQRLYREDFHPLCDLIWACLTFDPTERLALVLPRLAGCFSTNHPTNDLRSDSDGERFVNVSEKSKGKGTVFEEKAKDCVGSIKGMNIFAKAQTVTQRLTECLLKDWLVEVAACIHSAEKRSLAGEAEMARSEAGSEAVRELDLPVIFPALNAGETQGLALAAVVVARELLWDWEGLNEEENAQIGLVDARVSGFASTLKFKFWTSFKGNNFS